MVLPDEKQLEDDLAMIITWNRRDILGHDDARYRDSVWCHAMSDNELAYGAMRCACYAMRGTEIAYGGPAVLSRAVSTMKGSLLQGPLNKALHEAILVLTQRMVARKPCRASPSGTASPYHPKARYPMSGTDIAYGHLLTYHPPGRCDVYVCGTTAIEHGITDVAYGATAVELRRRPPAVLAQRSYRPRGRPQPVLAPYPRLVLGTICTATLLLSTVAWRYCV
eukprot:3941924-Rhodomonas_salina.4